LGVLTSGNSSGRPRDGTKPCGIARPRKASLLVSAVPNVSGCEQTVKSISYRVCAVPLRMLQVPRPGLNRRTTRAMFCARTDSKIKSQVKPQTAARRES